MTSNHPYLLRAIYEWILDNNMTPYIVVDAANSDIVVPDILSTNDQIILNIYPDAVRDLQLLNDSVSFSARFSGVSHSIFLPIESIKAVYAKESGRGIIFDQEMEIDAAEPDDDDSSTDQDTKSDNQSKRSHLRLIK